MVFVREPVYNGIKEELESYRKAYRTAMETINSLLNSNEALYTQNRKLQNEVKKYRRIAYASDNARRKAKSEGEFEKLDVIYEDGAYEIEKAHTDDVGFDIKTPDKFVIEAGKTAVIDTKVRMLIPKGYDCKVESKSGLMSKHYVFAVGGEIDAGYTGNVKVILHNLSDTDYTFDAGDKIAQLVFRRFENPKINKVKKFTQTTERGENGFGSSGR